MKAKKRILIIFLILLLIAVIYGITWYRIYSMTEVYFLQAEENYEQGKMGLALKGGTDFVTGEFVGSYQQVIEGWKGSSALPKPGFYKKALDRKQELIESLSVKEINDIFKRYFKVDNLYLDELLFRKAELLELEGKLEEADEVYGTIREIFPLNKTVQDKITHKMEERE